MLITEREIHYLDDRTVAIDVSHKDGVFSVLIDREDLDKIPRNRIWIKHRGVRKKTPYVMVSDISDKKKRIELHLLLLNHKRPNGYTIDHIKCDTLDNRKEQLRICTISENAKNVSKKISVKHSSEYKGVSKSGGKWHSEISANGERVYLGRYINEIDAAKAYNEAAVRLHGEFANLNKL